MLNSPLNPAMKNERDQDFKSDFERLRHLAVPMPSELLSALQYIGIGILLCATLARAESAIETIDGESIPERVDFWLYRALYVIGSYFLAPSVRW